MKNKKIFFFHVPKCAGLSLFFALSNSLNSFRIPGRCYITKSIEKNSNFDFFISKKINTTNISLGIKPNHYFSGEIYNILFQKLGNFELLSGHLPSRALKESQRYTFTILRDPIDRAISNYRFDLQRGLYSINDKIKDLYTKEILQPNLMTCFFSDDGKPKIKSAIKNIKKLNLITDVKEIDSLYIYLTNLFDLKHADLIHQNKTQIQTEINNDELEHIKKFNKVDEEFYKECKPFFHNFK